MSDALFDSFLPQRRFAPVSHHGPATTADSWEDDAVVIDRQAGVYADTDRIHKINHRGPFFRVRGPLDLPRSPQGTPVLVQAGSSEEGREFAAAYAEAIFTAQQELPDAQTFYADVKSRAARFGRDPDQIKILPGLSPILGATEREAQALERELNELIIPEVGLRHLSARFDGVDLSGFPLDGPVPVHVLPRPETVQGAQSRTVVILAMIEREKPTLRQLLHRLAGGRGHKVVAGTPEQVADHLIAWFEGRAADGFNIMPAYLPGGLEDFVDHVLPILQRRGVFRSQYDAETLRGHYGLERRPSRYSRQSAPMPEVA